MEITGKAVAVYGKKENKLCFFKIYDYETQEDEAQNKFIELMNDLSVGEYRIMTVENLSEILEEGCRVLD
jgi:hypothetical protein